MGPEELFDIWAPDDSIWSKWAKPAIFTVSLGGISLGGPFEKADLYTWRSGMGQTAAIINLPGVDSVKYGLALAEQGFRPVPLFNSIDGSGAILSVAPVRAALEEGAENLRLANIRPDAPPAFLLDSLRMEGSARPGAFDNRWVVFPQDFPSSTFLLAHGIKRVILVQRNNVIDRDLAQVLGLWKRAGLEILVMNGELAEPDVPQNLRKINRFDFARVAFGVLLISSLHLRRSNAGGFGSYIPAPERGG